ncbi:MAG: Stf0 family sulphotransferase [Roseibium sp.]
MSAFRSYILCTSPRSGSTLLCNLLAATGVAGRPGSLFHEPSLDAWLEYFGLAPDTGETQRETLGRVFAAALGKGTGGTGIFGLRLQRHSFNFFIRKLAVLHPEGSSDLDRLRAAFGETLFIHLTRRDKIGQAVSFVRAKQSGLWHRAADGSELERLSAPRPLQYDPAALKECHDRFTRFDRDWQGWFANEGISPLRIAYEDLSADPRATLRRVLGHLGRDRPAADRVVPGVAKLADATSTEWATRFRQDLETINAG